MNYCFEFCFFSLGTLNNIQLFYDKETTALQEKIIRRVQEIDNHMSAYKESSDISRIIENPGEFVKVHKDTLEVINQALMFYRNSNGAFDITIRPLTKLWSIGKKQTYIPEDDLIVNAVKKVDSSKIMIDKEKSSIQFHMKGGAIDLGGIAKGYAADEVKRILMDHGVKHAMINLGGNIVAVGKKPDNTSWKIGIQHPLLPRGKHLLTIEVDNKTVVTSGSYEQFFIKDKVRYHHILDPRTGYPAKSSLYSVTTICDNSMDADALTTSLFVLGLEKGMNLLKNIEAEAIFITDSMEVIVTNGRDKYQKVIRNEIKDRRDMYVC